MVGLVLPFVLVRGGIRASRDEDEHVVKRGVGARVKASAQRRGSGVTHSILEAIDDRTPENDRRKQAAYGRASTAVVVTHGSWIIEVESYGGSVRGAV